MAIQDYDISIEYFTGKINSVADTLSRLPEKENAAKMSHSDGKKCYEDDENSRRMLGKKDYISVKKEDGTREQVQKRLILYNFSELYA